MEFSEGTRDVPGTLAGAARRGVHRGPPQPRLHGSANFLPTLITSSPTLYQTRVYKRTVLRPLSVLPVRLVPRLSRNSSTSASFPKVPFVSSLSVVKLPLSFQDIPLGIPTRGAQTIRFTRTMQIFL